MRGNQAMYAAQWALLPPETWDEATTGATTTGAPSVGPDGQVVSPFAAAATGAGAASVGQEEEPLEEEEPLDPNRELLPLTMAGPIGYSHHHTTNYAPYTRLFYRSPPMEITYFTRLKP